MGATDRTLACPECGSRTSRGVKFCAECGISLNGLELDLGTLVGNYRLMELLGEGGMGRVYVGEHIKLGRRVAIKKLRSELVSNPSAVARFFAEARAVNRISHDNIVEITDFFEQPGGDNYIVMELLKGEDLAHRLQRRRTLALARALDITAQVASALSAVHGAGMIHRDLKPDNIYLIERAGSADFVKVLDFGVAKLTDGADRRTGDVHVTAAGQIIGTPEYMSPEQAAGRPIDARTDIYALGVILYEMVSGELPFQAKSFGDLLIQHMTAPVELPAASPGLPHELNLARDQLILDMMAKEPGGRPRSMRELEIRIRKLLDAMELSQSARKRLALTDSQGAVASAGGAVARVALVKRVTPPAVVEIGSPRSVSRIEVPTGSSRISAPMPAMSPHPTPVEQPPAGRLARASTDCPSDSIDASIYPSIEPWGDPSVDARTPTADAVRPPPGPPPDGPVTTPMRAVADTGAASRPASEPPAGPVTTPMRAVAGAQRRSSRPVIDPSGEVAPPARPRTGGGLPRATPSNPLPEAPGRQTREPAPTPLLATDDPVEPFDTLPNPVFDSATNPAFDAATNPELSPGARATEQLDIPDLLDVLDVLDVRSAAPPAGAMASSAGGTDRKALRAAADPGPAPPAARPTPQPRRPTSPRLEVRRTAERAPELRKPAETRGAGNASAPPRRHSRSEPPPPPLQRGRRAEGDAPAVAREPSVPRTSPPRVRRGFLVVGGFVAVAFAAWTVGDELRESGLGNDRVVRAAAPPTEVTIKFVSAPPGATVRIYGQTEALGVTPFVQSFRRGGQAVMVEFDKPGYVPISEVVTLGADDALAATLTPLAVPPPPPLASPLPSTGEPPARQAAQKPERPRRGGGKPVSPPNPTLDRNGTLDIFKK